MIFPCGSSRILAQGGGGTRTILDRFLIFLWLCLMCFRFSSHFGGRGLGARHDYQTLVRALYKERPRPPRLTLDLLFISLYPSLLLTLISVVHFFSSLFSKMIFVCPKVSTGLAPYPALGVYGLT